MSESIRLFVACAPGLEPLLVDELRELELEIDRSLAGGVELSGEPETLYRVLLGCGLGLREQLKPSPALRGCCGWSGQRP